MLRCEVMVSDIPAGLVLPRFYLQTCVRIGLASVKSRLDNLVGGSLEIESEKGAGTTVTIVIPKSTEVNGK